MSNDRRKVGLAPGLENAKRPDFAPRPGACPAFSGRQSIMRRTSGSRTSALTSISLGVLLFFVALSGQGLPVHAASPEFSPDQVEFFRSKVQPILTARCLKCHGGQAKVRGGLRVDSREAIVNGGELGPALSLEKPDESLLLQAINYVDLEMPPSGRLPKEEVDTLTRWVRQGAPWTPGVKAPAANPSPPEAVKADSPADHRDYWAYRPITRPAVPSVKNVDWGRNSIDAFILSRLEHEGLAPVAEADRVTLLRRVSYDLTGLPPTPEEVDAYLADKSEDAYERLVDRLLDSPRYGEKWGRHWLDLVRFAETNGYERDSAKPNAWRYRDYVIDSFNRDKPYDRFLAEQLAGDEIDPTSPEAMIATGYYRLGMWDDEPADKPLARYEVLDGILSTTAQVMLGTTVNCARCHDHKKDPIPQTDYYRLLAFFIDVTNQDGKNSKPLEVGPGRKMDVMCVSEAGKNEAHVLLRGNPNLIGPKVEPGVPIVLGGDQATFVAGPGKRRALAEWLVDRRNPLTARVFANRIWQYHFGRGIVPTSNDFGKLGEAPTHPALLDWLASELRDGGWTLKRMHRLIMGSSSYRMSSMGSEPGLKQDPANLLFWRFPMRRLQAEEVRDSILSVTGTLNLKAGGPSIFPPIPKDVMAGQSVPGKGWSVSPPDEAARRSVYVHVKRSLIVPILAIHDAADTDSSCAVRYTTTVPTQSLGLLNGAFANEQARVFAARLQREAPGDLAGQVRRAIRLTTAHEAAAEEVDRDVAFVETLRTKGRMKPDEALVKYCLLSLNANEFIYLD
jgi:hypothetical protein